MVLETYIVIVDNWFKMLFELLKNLYYYILKFYKETLKTLLNLTIKSTLTMCW